MFTLMSVGEPLVATQGTTLHSSQTTWINPSCLVQVTELQVETNENGVTKVTGGAAGDEEEEEDDDNVGDFEGIHDDSDEEYVPVAEPSSSAATPQKRKAQSKTNKTEKAEEDSKQDSVQCPVCNKSFKSKYYLKVHNR